MLKYKRYLPKILLNLIKKKTFGSKANKYLFILGPTHSGTTLMNELLSSSRNASSNNNRHTREGQLLPTVRQHMFTHRQQWNENLKFDWKFIRKEWLKYWDVTKPILIEKSPPNLLRAPAIEETFTPSYFIVFVRNPYAHCETFIRKNKYSPTQAARFIINCLKYQQKNLKILKNAVLVTYENVVDYPEEFKKTISAFIPELNDIQLDKKFNAHNYYNTPQSITNFNLEKTQRLHKDDIQEINHVFQQHESLLAFFGYKIESYETLLKRCDTSD